MYEIWYNQLIRRSIIGWFSNEGWRKWMMNFIFLRTARAYLVIMKKYNLLWKRSECYIENFQRCARPFVKKFTRKSTTNIRTPPIPCGPDLRWWKIMTMMKSLFTMNSWKNWLLRWPWGLSSWWRRWWWGDCNFMLMMMTSSPVVET